MRSYLQSEEPVITQCSALGSYVHGAEIGSYQSTNRLYKSCSRGARHQYIVTHIMGVLSGAYSFRNHIHYTTFSQVLSSKSNENENKMRLCTSH